MADEASLRREIAVEQQHVDRVYARLATLRAATVQAEEAGYRQADVGTVGALVERDALVFHAARRRRAFDSEHEGLVFGRLDLRPDRSRSGESPRYIGRLGLRGERAEPLVIDWRAPAAAAFYQATARDPQGVVRRRLIQSTGEKVTGVEDDLLDPANAPADMSVVGDGALLAALSRARGASMRDIVATIQHEQDLAIRAPASGVTLVEGGPGTGKTAVALHRAAYLLYQDRGRFVGGGVLIVGPSPVFVDYIESVLPALGEDSATLKAVGQLVAGVEAKREEATAARAVKGSLRMCRVLRRASEDAPPGVPAGLRIRYRGTWLTLTHRQGENIRQRVGRGRRRNEVRRAAFQAVLGRLWLSHRRELRPLTRAQFDDDLIDHDAFRQYLRSWWPIVTPREVLGWLADPARLTRYCADILTPAERTTLLASMSQLGELGPSVHDVALLDELETYLGHRPTVKRPAPAPFTVLGKQEVVTTFEREQAARTWQRPDDYREFAHIIVDEVQDITPMQWRVLGRRGQLASWTLVGDPVQSAWTGDPAEQVSARTEALGAKKVRRYVLRTNYRNSTEIFAAAAQVIRSVLPDAALPTAVRSNGLTPVHLLVPASALPTTVRRSVADLLAAVVGTVGVITPDAHGCAEAHEWLSGLAGAEARLTVVSAFEAKGMEYDAVVVVRPEDIIAGSPLGHRTLYVALTRATQRLGTVATASWRNVVGPPDPDDSVALPRPAWSGLSAGAPPRHRSPGHPEGSAERSGHPGRRAP
ncbi:HelD family protein [Micromonospora auratinigra]|uniref:DNA helicase IV n=1 Tax=Micromonospora auratinigra TaxID=261654 RepID=A0A1A8Z4N7_9ACTN|nr:AAA family ATPase [Micromonospora auratinigra]SBT38767.1 DNA helicase IV [Micromonospora auratinigra]